MMLRANEMRNDWHSILSEWRNIKLTFLFNTKKPFVLYIEQSSLHLHER